MRLPFPNGMRANVGWASLLGDFGVEVNVRHSRVCSRREKITFGYISDQGFPFYGGIYPIIFPSQQNMGISAYVPPVAVA